MPPFPGNSAELDALVAFVMEMDKNPRYIRGAQSQGVTISPKHSLKKTEREGT